MFASQFDLVCSRHMLVEVSMMLNNVGQAIGAFLFSMLSDKFGRKLIFLGCLWGNVAVALAQAFSVNMAMYTSLAFFDGLLQAVGITLFSFSNSDFVTIMAIISALFL